MRLDAVCVLVLVCRDVCVLVWRVCRDVYVLTLVGSAWRDAWAHDVWAHAEGGDREVVLDHSPHSLVILQREDQVWTHA